MKKHILVPTLQRGNAYRAAPAARLGAGAPSYTLPRWSVGARRIWFFIPLFFLLLTACSQAPGSGPVDITWDRDACEHCRMVLSDRYFAAEIRGGPRKDVFKFDDLGCALEWLEKQDWPDREQAEIWVKDYQTGNWLDARQAHYVPGRITPMDYGLGASAQAGPGSLLFAEARARILASPHRHAPTE